MSNEISVFTFENHEVRIVDQNGEPWWIAKDVCEILGYTGSVSQILSNICRDGVMNRDTIKLTDSLGRKQPTTIISELNLNRLIMRSKKPEAEKFQDWVCGEVLPSIRKTGQYSVSPEAEKQPELIKCSVDGHVYEFPIIQSVKSVSCAKSGAITFHFFGEEQKSANPREKNAPAKREKNASAKKSPKPEPTDNRLTELITFLEEQCRVHSDYWVRSNDLYKCYLEWTNDNSIKLIYIKKHFFYFLNRILGKNVVRKRRRNSNDRKQFRVYAGIALLEKLSSSVKE